MIHRTRTVLASGAILAVASFALAACGGDPEPQAADSAFDDGLAAFDDFADSEPLADLDYATASASDLDEAWTEQSVDGAWEVAEYAPADETHSARFCLSGPDEVWVTLTNWDTGRLLLGRGECSYTDADADVIVSVVGAERVVEKGEGRLGGTYATLAEASTAAFAQSTAAAIDVAVTSVSLRPAADPGSSGDSGDAALDYPADLDGVLALRDVSRLLDTAADEEAGYALTSYEGTADGFSLCVSAADGTWAVYDSRTATTGESAGGVTALGSEAPGCGE